MKGWEPDVIVVGSGAGGGAAAWRLASRGAKVLVLERGRWYEGWRDFGVHVPNGRWNAPDFTADLSLERPADEAPGPVPGDLRSWTKNSRPGAAPPAPFTVNRCFGVGGSTLAFQGEAHRFAETSFRLRSEQGVGEDWPLAYADLEPYYDEMERVLAVAGGGPLPARPRRGPYPQPAHAFSAASRRIAEGCRRLGYALAPNPVAILSRPHEGRPACLRCGRCDTGCLVDAKSSSDVALVRRAVATGRCRVLAGCRVLEVLSSPDGTARGVLYKDAQGDAAELRARAVVLAAGSVETPRLLFRSGGARPEGLANSSGWLGRGLMDNVHVIVAGAFDERFDPRGLPIDARVWDFGSKGPAARGVPGGCGLGVSGVDAAYPGPLPYAARLAALWGEEHHRTMREHFGRVVCVFGVAEKLPDPENRLERDPVRRDEDGYPELRVSTRRPPGEARQLEFLREACRGLLDASGAREIVQETFSGDSGGGGTHVVGTCRMGKDPARSVVDPWGRAHDVRNLFVADGSVFVTQGGGDSPSLTIQALALRAADRLADALAKGEL